jgi:selenocysteine-specific elongation factor
VASFVDVPGHERFVRNMLAGAHGIDAVLLVVAADESVMPQTREHFQISCLLGVPRGLIAITKCDLADEESQALAELEARALVEGSFLAGRPVLRVSARTGRGLPALRDALTTLAHEAPPRSSESLFRLPVDRVFTLRGFGTVVTGTLVGGEVGLGDGLEALPAGKLVRVRNLEVHGAAVPRVRAGTRAALNLGGLEPTDLRRGDVLVAPGTLRATSMLDVEITLLETARQLRDGSRVRVHIASAEVLARARLLGAQQLEPGGRVVAQLRLERAAVAGRGDRLVLRSLSPPETIGGAVVVDPLPPRRRAADRGAVERLRDARGTGAAAALMVEQGGVAGVDVQCLSARLSVPASRLSDALVDEPSVVRVGPVLVSRSTLLQLSRETVAALGRLHLERPLQTGVPREELRRRASPPAPTAVFDRVIEDLARAGTVRTAHDTIALADHRVRLSAGEEDARQALVEAAVAAGVAGVEVRALSERTGRPAPVLERVAGVVVREGLLARVGGAILVHRDALETLKQDVRRRWPPGSRLDVSAIKELTGLSRKHVIPLLEYLDRERVTRRAGEGRVVLG